MSPASGAVRSARRGLVEIDRPRLEEAACECYEVMRCKFDQIFPLDTTWIQQSVVLRLRRNAKLRAIEIPFWPNRIPNHSLQERCIA